MCNNANKALFMKAKKPVRHNFNIQQQIMTNHGSPKAMEYKMAFKKQ